MRYPVHLDFDGYGDLLLTGIAAKFMVGIEIVMP
jgi:hypothetical protein